MRFRPTGVVIPVFNRRVAALACIESVLADAPIEAPVVIVDDGSEDGLREELQLFERRCEVIRNDKNLGLGRSCNIGFRRAKELGAGDIIRVNGDILVLPGWYEALEKAAQSVPGAGVVAPIYPRGVLDERWRFHTWTEEEAGCSLGCVPFVVGHCLLVRDRIWEKRFRWDENLYPVGPDNLDLCMKSSVLGLRNCVVRTAICKILDCEHSLKWHRPEFRSCFSVGRKYLEKKWEAVAPNVVFP